MIDRWLSHLELFLLRKAPHWSVSIRSRRNHVVRTDKEFLELFDDLQRRKVIIQSMSEAFNLWQLCPKTARVQGDIAELGVYLGGTARLLSQIKGDRRLFLFDTFGGMPEVKEGLDKVQAGTFAETRLADVQRLMSGEKNVHFCAGFFPQSTKQLPGDAQKFSFVHLDADIYQSTLDGLTFFYPRLSPGGMIVAHDYRYLQCPGVKQAFTEFFANKPEPVLELWDTQCLVVKYSSTPDQR
ncbi:MAG: macrocin-O-methyltransferase [Verrucomicrobia bacterium]|nr:macrocin-O-methyltransferase [Verrucomicrobiota bacterium]